GRVVPAGLAFGQVAGEQVAYRRAVDAAPADQLADAEAAVRRQRAHGRRRGAAEDARGVQQLVEVRALVVRDLADRGSRIEELQAVTDGDVGDHPAFGGHDGSDPVQGHRSGRLADRAGVTAGGQAG